MSLSNQDNSLNRARSIPLNKRISGLVGESDKFDYYSFKLTKFSDLTLSFGRLKSGSRVQVKLLNSSGNTLVKFSGGNKAQAVENTLASGKYYIRVANKGRNQSISYQFKATTSPGEPGETPQAAYDIGKLAASFTYRDRVNEKDTLDYYKFSLDYLSDFSAGFSGVSGSATMSLYRDANDDGLVDNREKLDYTTNTQSSISRFLAPGRYFITIEKYSVATDYNLALTTTPYPEYTTAIDDNRPLSARNITLAQPFKTKDYVGEFDDLDFYKFSLNAVSDFNANISGVPGYARLDLYRDNNNNGLADSNERLNYAFSEQDGNNIAELLISGSYFVGVEKYSTTTRYDLVLNITPYPDYTVAVDSGDRPLTARNLGIFPGSFTVKDYVGDLDKADYYKFSLNQTQNFNASFSASSGSISMVLYHDVNNNGLIDSGERVDGKIGYPANNISKSLTSGIYFLAIEQYGGSTRYDLSLQTI
jgi:hypothetical protein